MIECLLVGYGSQGMRVADALSAQPDMHLFGVGLKVPDITAHIASKRGCAIYTMGDEDVGVFEDSGIRVYGSLSGALSEVDVVVDATPSGFGKRNKEELYSKYNVKSIFQAGEDLKVADIPVFISSVNYNDGGISNSARIPSPFTVSLIGGFLNRWMMSLVLNG